MDANSPFLPAQERTAMTHLVTFLRKPDFAADVKVGFCLDVGRTSTFLGQDRSDARDAFNAVLPGRRDFVIKHATLPENTVLYIVIWAAASIAGGFLTELGQDLWKAVRRLIKDGKRTLSANRSGRRDEIRLELRVGEGWRQAKLSNLGAKSTPRVENFLKTTPSRLYREIATRKKQTRGRKK